MIYSFPHFAYVRIQSKLASSRSLICKGTIAKSFPPGASRTGGFPKDSSPNPGPQYLTQPPGWLHHQQQEVSQYAPLPHPTQINRKEITRDKRTRKEPLAVMKSPVEKERENQEKPQQHLTKFRLEIAVQNTAPNQPNLEMLM